MVFPRSLLFRLSTCVQLISPLLLRLLLLTRGDARNLSEVQILSNFKASMVVNTPGNVSFVDNTWVEIDNSGGYWSYWTSWNETDSTPCNWVGVTCTPMSTVAELDLSGWELYHLPAESLEILSNLTDLRVLDLSDNYFGTVYPYVIPDTIQTLTGLEVLNIPYNSFTGPIPANISACRNLRYISIEYNYLSGDMQSLRGLAKLQVLLLRYNRFSGPFPTELGEMSSLINVDLSGNFLNGTIPNLPNLTTLLDLKLDGNMFTGFEGPSFPSMMSLEHLSITANQLEGAIPSGIANLPNLRDLDLSGNKLSGNIPAELLQPSITFGITMNLSNNLLSGDIPLNGTKSCRYSYIDLSNNNLSGQIPFINNNTQVCALRLQNNLLSGDIVDFLADSPGLAPMTELRLGNNSLSGDLSRIVDIDASFEYLLAVDLSNNSFQITKGAIPDPLKAVLDFFSVEGRLTEFWVGGNNFSGTSLPSNLGIYSALQILDFSNNHLMGPISAAAFNSTFLPSLRYLNLSYDELTGPIPEAVLMLPDLTTLDVTYNKLSGELPYIPPNTGLYNPTFYANNNGLCGGPLTACPQDSSKGVPWWAWLIVTGSVTVAVGSFLVATWRWKVYHKRHRQDADLIKTLMERESTTLMSLSELRRATQNFAENAQIGEGGFGIVYTGKLNDGTIVAIKRSKHEGSEKDKQQFLNEVRILSQVNHRNLVKLLGCCMENKIALLVFEFVANGTLQEHLRGKFGHRLSWKQRLLIAVQTADALNYLHSAAMFPIYHRDVKSANILLDANLNTKVSDFGISRLAPLHATHVSTMEIRGTLGYIDPEYYTSFQLTDKSDVYSYGVVLLELISAKPAIDFGRGVEGTGLVTFATSQIERGDLQQLLDPTLSDTYNDPSGNGRESILNVGRLAMMCLEKQSKARPSMKEVWKELQTIWLELEGTSRSVHSRIEVDEEDHLFQILL